MVPGNRPQFPGELFLRDADVSEEDAVSHFLFELTCIIVISAVVVHFALQWWSALTPTF